jgi:hypothetical protein
MAAGSTYTPISTQTLSSTATTVTFSSIPSTYTDLVLTMVVTADSTAFNVFYRLNSDSSSNYSWTLMGGDGTSAGSVKIASQPEGRLTYYAAVRSSTPTFTQANFMNYSNTTTKKTVISRSNRTSDGVEYAVNNWFNATPQAINNISIFANVGAFAAGSTFTLHGISAA